MTVRIASVILSAKVRRRPGFTLIELMISIALSLLLVLGINAVFKMSADTVGTGMQLGEINRQFRLARTQFDNDLSHMASIDSNPALIIQSINQPAFKDRAAEQAAMAASGGLNGPYDPTKTDLDTLQQWVLDVRDATGASAYRNSSIAPNIFLPQILTNANHRVDSLSFVVKNPDTLQRQSPNFGNGFFTNQPMNKAGSEYQGAFKSTEAYVTYGHLLQPDNSVNASNMLSFDKTSATPGGQTHFLGLGVTKDPYTPNVYVSGANGAAVSGTQVNPNNFYASNWIVGRTAMLLGEPSQLDNFTNPYQSGVADPQSYAYDPVAQQIGYQATEPVAQQAALRPLSWGSPINVATASGNIANWPVQSQSSQCDVAGISTLTLHQKALNAQNPTGTANYLPRWYLPLVAMGCGVGEPVPTGTNPQLPGTAPGPQGWVWPQTTSTNTQLGLQPWNAYRFMGQAWPDKLAGANTAVMGNAPGMHQQLAVQTPVFLRGCSQFIVEYAGDYLQQVTDPNDTSAPTKPNVNPNATPRTAPVGTIKGIGEDGQIDFDAITDNASGTIIKRIRWYGMTRSLDDGQSVEDTSVPNIRPLMTPGSAPGRPPTQSEIVRPLYRYIQTYTQGTRIPGLSNITYLPFEKVVNPVGINGLPTYAGFPDKRPQNIDSYTCAWGPLEMDLDQMPTSITSDPYWTQMLPLLKKTGAQAAFPSRSLLPWMIRITVRLDDPAGRLPDGQTMQFIFNVPRPH